jgi:hypothetical protein
MGALLALTLFGSAIYFWMAVIMFVIICFIADAHENGFAAFGFLIVFSICFYIWSDVKAILALFTIASVTGYLLVGLGFSMFRTFFAGRKLGKKIKDLPSAEIEKDGYTKSGTKERAKQNFLEEMQGNVFRWWFMWPISLLSWVATDFIVEAWEYSYSKISGLYNYILELGMKSIS